MFGHVSILKKLLSLQADINIRNNGESTVMHFAALYIENPEIIALLAKAGIGLDDIDQLGRTPLHIAIEHGNMKAAKKLLDLGASVAIQDKMGRVPLHIAAEKGNKQAAELLLVAGAFVDITDIYGRTPLNRAATKGHLSTVRILQKKSKKENFFQQKNKIQPMSFSSNDKTHLIHSLINEGSSLMKTFNYEQANMKFNQALQEVNGHVKYASDDRLKRELSRLIHKSQLLMTKNSMSNPLEFGASLDTSNKIMSRIIRLESISFEEIHDVIIKLLKKPLLKPILEYIAMDFMINEKAHIMILDPGSNLSKETHAG